MAKQKFELAKLQANDLKELDGWKVKMKDLVEKNPYIEIVDAESYKEAKMSRTALKSGRTEVQNQDKAIGSFLRQFRSSTKAKGDDMILIVKPHEDKQQTEIDRWEKILNEKANQKILDEENRIEGHKEKIKTFEKSLSFYINEMNFNVIKEMTSSFESEIAIFRDANDLQEFEILFDDMVATQTIIFNDTVVALKHGEENRLEQIEKDQDAEINRRSVAAQNLIDLSNPDNQHELIEKIDEIMLAEYDFGEFKKHFETVRVTTTNKAVDRVKWIQNNQVTEQRNRVINVREGLLDIVFQMTVEDYEEKTIYVEKALTQKVNDLLVEDEFAKMLSRVKPALKTKLELIAKEIEKNNERIEKRTVQRKKQLKEIGLAWNKADKFFHCEGIDDINESVIDDLEHAEWQTYVQSLKIIMTQFKDENVAYQKRVKRLKSDKEKMIVALTQFKMDFEKGEKLANAESKTLWDGISVEFNEWAELWIKNIDIW